MRVALNHDNRVNNKTTQRQLAKTDQILSKNLSIQNRCWYELQTTWTHQINSEQEAVNMHNTVIHWWYR